MSKAAKRYGSVIKLNADKVAEYKALHASVWPAVLARLEKSNVRNYTIYYSAQLGLLFSHFEYIGEDFDGDMSAVGEDPVTKDWWKNIEVYDGHLSGPEFPAMLKPLSPYGRPSCGDTDHDSSDGDVNESSGEHTTTRRTRAQNGTHSKVN